MNPSIALKDGEKIEDNYNTNIMKCGMGENNVETDTELALSVLIKKIFDNNQWIIYVQCQKDKHWIIK